MEPSSLGISVSEKPGRSAAPGQYEYASADVRLTVSGAGKYLGVAYVKAVNQPNTSFPLQASFENLASAAAYGYLDLQIRSHTYDVGPPVPEPHTAALLMTGLAITAVAARRRRL